MKKVKFIESIKEKIEKNEPLTSGEKQAYILYSLTSGSESGKMHDFTMITTSCLYNPLCIARHENDDLVCYYCYARAQLEHQKTFREKRLFNSIFYSEYELSFDDIPMIYTINNVLRFESHGDYINELHAKNHYMIALKNKHLHCGLWTKNPWFFSNLDKPNNVKFVVSTDKLNVDITLHDLESIKAKYPYVDKLFSVYSKDYITDHNIDVNCGGNDCMNCLTCYLSDDVNLIYEQLK